MEKKDTQKGVFP